MSKPSILQTKYIKQRSTNIPKANSIFRSKWASHAYMYRNITEDMLDTYLLNSPDYLEKFILTQVSAEQIKQWHIMKMHGNFDDAMAHDGEEARILDLEARASDGIFWTDSCKDLIHKIVSVSANTTRRVEILVELQDSLKNALMADESHLYIVDESENYIYYYCDDNKHTMSTSPCVRKIGKGTIVSAFVADSRVSENIGDICHVDRSSNFYPDGIIFNNPKIKSVLAQPIVMDDGKVLGVIELFRYVGRQPFLTHDVKISETLATWACLSIFYSDECMRTSRQQMMNEFSLSVTRSIFDKIHTIDKLIIDIIKFAKKLVEADRGTLFIVDHETGNIISHIIDKGNSQYDVRDTIRFSMKKGIAGHVARTGETLRIADVYQDNRFNRDIDQMTGYTTRSLLCMPVKNHDKIVGVMQLLNKKDGEFTSNDEINLETFNIYCGLALHIAEMYNNIRKSEQKFKVGMEILSYHNCYTKQEYKQLCSLRFPLTIDKICNFTFSCWGVPENQKPLYFIYMFGDLFGLKEQFVNEPERHLHSIDSEMSFNFKPSIPSMTGEIDGIQAKDLKFDYSTLAKFVLTVRRNYRQVPYHNWGHAFSVTHSLYTILKMTSQQFKLVEQIALFIACICHDIDHRGKTNAYMVKISGSSIAQLYSTSTMEYHHYNITVMLLQREELNIFKHLSVECYKKLLDLIKHCILATDLVKFFEYKAKLEKIVHNEPCKLDWSNDYHRSVLMAICMTTSDLCSMYKPWKLQVALVMFIMKEFWIQGDCEKQAGHTPIVLMDRNNSEQLPESQVGFLKAICIPCYTILYRVLPEMRPVVKNARNNLRTWEAFAQLPKEQKKKKLKELEILPEGFYML